MILSKTNYRVSILGGSVDFPEFYSQYGGYLIGFPLKQHVYTMINFIPELNHTRYQAFYSFPEKVAQISEFKNPAIYGSLTYLESKLGKLPPLSIHLNNTLPSRSGLASSSALILGIIQGILTLLGHEFTKKDLADMTNHIERIVLAEPGGRQDPWFCSHAGLGSLIMDKSGNISHKQFNLSENFINEFKKSSIIFYYSERESFKVAKSYTYKQAEKYKLRLLDIAKEGKSAFEAENINWIIDLLKQNWAEKRQISKLISTPEIDKINDIITSRGGSAKVCGSGGGGGIYCLCPIDKREEIISLVNLPTIPVDIDLKGAEIIYNDEN